MNLKDETGQTIERVIPKAEYQKNISLFYVDNKSGYPALDWLQYCTIFMLSYDLEQDLFIYAFPSYDLDKIKKAGYKKAVGLPLLLKREITSESHMDYFLSGGFRKEKDDLIFEISLYRSKNAKLVANTAIMFENDWSKALKYYNESLEEDPNFTAARISLAGFYLLTNQAGKSHEIFQTIMQELFKLPERLQFHVKFYYYALKPDLEKQIAVLRMIIKLYPRDIEAYSLLAPLLELKGQYDEAIDLYKHILAIDSRRYEVLQLIGKLYKSKGDFQQALTFYQKYAEHSAAPPTDGLDQMKAAYESGWAGGIMKTAFDNVPIHIPGKYMHLFNRYTYGKDHRLDYASIGRGGSQTL